MYQNLQCTNQWADKGVLSHVNKQYTPTQLEAQLVVLSCLQLGLQLFECPTAHTVGYSMQSSGLYLQSLRMACS